MIWEKAYSRAGPIITRKILDETILVPIRGTLADMQKIFSLNSVAESIWRQLDGQRTLKDIRKEIMATYDANKEQVDADIVEFIDELLKSELIVE